MNIFFSIQIALKVDVMNTSTGLLVLKKITTLLLLLFCISAKGQKDSLTLYETQKLNWGYYHHMNGAHEKAIRIFLSLGEKIPTPAIKELSISYAALEEKDSAAIVMGRIIDTPFVEVEDYYYYANLLTANSKLAKEYFLKAERLPLFYEKSDRSHQKNRQKLHNIQANSSKSEFGAYFAKADQQSMVYFLKPHDKQWEKKLRNKIVGSREIYHLYRAAFDPENLELDFPTRVPTNPSEIFQEGPIAIDTEAKILYLSRSSGKLDRNNKLQVDLYSYEYTEENQRPKRLPINLEGHSTLHPSVNREEQRLYFASDRPGGKGGMDLYYIPLNEAHTATDAINLGKDINTPNNESFPFSEASGALFYTYEAQERQGDFDIILAEKSVENRWKTFPLKAPFNSVADDFSFSLLFNEGIGSLSSNRSGGKGNDDIYMFDYHPEVVGVEDHYSYFTEDTLVVAHENVWNNDRKRMLDIDPISQLLEKEIQLVDAPRHGVLQLNPNGSFYYKEQQLLREKDSFSYQIATSFGNSEKIWVYLHPLPKPIPKNVAEAFLPIFYDTDKAHISEAYWDRVEGIVKTMNAYPNMIVEVIATADCRGSSAYNLTLSEKRSQRLLDYVKNHITQPDRIRGQGVGESQIQGQNTPNYNLILGSFLSEENAKKRQLKLQEMGINSLLEKSNEGHWKLIEHYYESYTAAKRQREFLKTKNIEGWIQTGECLEKSEMEHQLQRRSEFKIVTMGSEK